MSETALWKAKWDKAEHVTTCAKCDLDIVQSYDFNFNDVWLGTNGSVFCNSTKPEQGQHSPDADAQVWIPEWLTTPPKG